MSPLPTQHPLADGRTGEAAFIRALRGERPAATPVWLPAPRAPWSTEAEDPAAVAERTLRPWRDAGTDAVVLASDIVHPLVLAGVDVERGPDDVARNADPVRNGSDVLRLRPIDPAQLASLQAATAIAAAELGATALVGVAGGPYSLAAVLLGEDGDAQQPRCRTLMYADPHTWAALLNWCADLAGAVLRAQVLAGASAVRLVDPHIGSLSRHDYFKRVLPHTQRVYSHLRGLDVPIIHTGRGDGEMLDLIARSGPAGVDVDRRIPLDTAAARLGGDVTLLGNLDPALLAAGDRIATAHVHDVLERGRAARAHILGVGGEVGADLPPAVLTRIVEQVHHAER